MTPYQTILKIDKKKFQDKSVAIIGAGWMGKQYAIALQAMKIKDVSIISNSKEKTLKFCEKFNFKPYYGGYEKNLPKLKNMDLVIITPSIEISINASKKAIETGQDNILIEKPASLFSKEIESFKKIIKKQRVRVAYNRLCYPNYVKLKELIQRDGGVTSCTFTITERVRDLKFPRSTRETHKRLGTYNSIHVISMVVGLIGMPKSCQYIQYEKLDWHPSGAIFVGSGISKKNIPFSYHGDWLSSGRWGIEIMTRKNSYRLISLEELFVSKIHKDIWKQVSFKKAYPDLKQGVAEEIAIMLDKKLEHKIKLPTLKQALEISKFTEDIFGYSKK